MALDTKASKPPKTVKKKNSSQSAWSRYGWPVLRHMIIPAVCLVMLFAGVSTGYVVLGDKPFSDVMEWDTWRHMFDLIFAKS
jgi:hypothetical protein